MVRGPGAHHAVSVQAFSRFKATLLDNLGWSLSGEPATSLCKVEDGWAHLS